jgi:dTDP-glucose 4,6-dehydratase
MILSSSPYSASKAASEQLVISWGRTYNLDYTITRGCNTIGKRQNKEKLLPKVILNAINEQDIPVYGKGENIREWIHVKDHCEAILSVLTKGKAGEIYNIGTDHTLTNISLIYRVLCILNKSEDLIKFVEDRKGHDFKYHINSSKIQKELGWSRKIKLNDGLEETIDYYKNKV